MELDISIHKHHLIKLLTHIYKNSYLNNSLGFKGGTAGMLFYGLNRFSVDLDFDLTQKISEDSPEIKKLMEEITAILEKENYTIKDKSEKFNTLFWAASYGAGTKQIKIEISTRKEPNNTYDIKNLYGIGIKTSTLPDLIAHKLVALVNRNKFVNRDLFDAHFYLSKYPENINYEVIKSILNKNPEEFFNYLLEFLNDIDTNSFLDGLGQLVSKDQKDWVRNSLYKETIGLVQKQIDLKLWKIKK